MAVLDLDSFTWRRPMTSGPAPSPRECASAAYHAGHMMLFGAPAVGAHDDALWATPHHTPTCSALPPPGVPRPLMSLFVAQGFF